MLLGLTFTVAFGALIHVSGAQGVADSPAEDWAGDPPDPGLGPPFSAWYLSLKTSKGYCGLAPAPAASGGYGFVIACNNKAVQYGSQFTLLLAPAAAAGSEGAEGGAEQRRPARNGEQEVWGGGGETVAVEAASGGESAWQHLGSNPRMGGRAAFRASAEPGQQGGTTGEAVNPISGADGAAASGGGRPAVSHQLAGGRRTREARHAARLLLSGPAGVGQSGGGGGGIFSGRATLQDAEGGGGSGSVRDGRRGPVLLNRAIGDAASGPGAGLRDPMGPVVVASGRTVRLLSRGAGLCNTPPPLPPAVAAPAPAAQPAKEGFAKGGGGGNGGGGGGGAAARLWAAVLACLREAWRAVGCWAAEVSGVAVPACAGRHARRGSELPSGAAQQPWPQPRQVGGVQGYAGGSAGGGSGGGGSGGGGSGGGGSGGGLGDVQPRAVVCALAQPSALTFRIYKPDLKDGVDLDLSKEWVYLMEGDKFCTLADVAGLGAVVSCHLDSPGWSGYKFQLQPVSYPRAQLRSLLTGSPCGVRLPAMPGPHDVECGPGQQGGRAPELELLLQTPGSAFVAGVVVGLSTFSAGLTGSEQQRCCAQVGSPHILLCEPPSSYAVANECWFQLYDVPLGAAPTLSDGLAAGGAVPRGGAAGMAAGLGSPWADVWRAFLRGLATELSPAGLDPDFGELAEAVPEPGAAGRPGGGPAPGEWSGAGRGGGGGADSADWDPDSRPDPQPSHLARQDSHGDGGGQSLGVWGARSGGNGGGSGYGAGDGGSGCGASVVTDGYDASAGAGSAAGHDAPFARSCGGRGCSEAAAAVVAAGGATAGRRLRAAAPLGDGSLVMLTSKAFGRYCSCSLDGTLLCVSAQASNASRNLFTLVLPPPPPPPAA